MYLSINHSNTRIIDSLLWLIDKKYTTLRMSARYHTVSQIIPAVLDTQLPSAVGKLTVLVLYAYYYSSNINWLALMQNTGFSPTLVIYGSLSLSHWRWSHHPPTLPHKLTHQMTQSSYLENTNKTVGNQLSTRFWREKNRLATVIFTRSSP